MIIEIGKRITSHLDLEEFHDFIHENKKIELAVWFGYSSLLHNQYSKANRKKFISTTDNALYTAKRGRAKHY